MIRTEEHRCLRKTRFDNKQKADQAAQRTRRSHPASGQDPRRRCDRRNVIRAYHCGYCGGWHVGHDAYGK